MHAIHIIPYLFWQEDLLKGLDRIETVSDLKKDWRPTHKASNNKQAGKTQEWS